jgi:hypothetical protein
MVGQANRARLYIACLSTWAAPRAGPSEIAHVPPTIALRQQLRRSHSPVTFPAMHRHHWLPMLPLYFCSPSHAAPVPRNETAAPNPTYVGSASPPQPWSRESIIALSALLVAFLCCLVSLAWPSIKRCANTRTAAQCKHIPSKSR